MPKRCYDPNLSLSERQLLLVQHANVIIREYEAMGFTLTLRQLYYQFVQRNLLANDQKNYKYLGQALNDGRLAGLVDWHALEDRTRGLVSFGGIGSVSKALKVAALGHRNNKWVTQLYRPEVWPEKDALTGVIAPTCAKFQVPYFACRGYNSQSEQWRAGMRMVRHIKRGKKPIVFHLGDHDPSGIDMTRDNRDRLNMFVEAETGQKIIFKRLALNMPQIEHYRPPPNPVKLTDGRAGKYVQRYGNASWELDSLPPTVLANLIEKAIRSVRDEPLWAAAVAKEKEQRGRLGAIARTEIAREKAAKSGEDKS